MPIPAHFEDLPVDPLRPRAARRQLRVESEGSTATGQTARVLIHNVSVTGLLIESAVELTADERIEIALPEIGTASAHVVWMSENFYGCRFETPLSTGALGALELYSQAAAAPVPVEPGDTLPVRIARLRKEQGLTLEALAALVNVSKPTVWAWEQGKSRPTQERIAALAQLLGVAEDELINGRDGEALANALSQARNVVAKAFGVDPSRVKVSIEL
ncbi:helix-turn-helix domain-containing protein [Novosphingobium sp.]|uniref:helix-turn-helix domain-containing protein n=1 Tax=Novosphingobium sp. TaxID=1874826 RepID=UPI003BABAC65